MAKPISVGAAGSKGARAASGALGPATAGRPVSNIQKYLVKPSAEVNSGYEMINADPNVLKEVHRKYLNKFAMPPALQPFRPDVLEARRAKAISKGWRDPRGRKG